jgi:hypothetical protein
MMIKNLVVVIMVVISCYSCNSQTNTTTVGQVDVSSSIYSAQEFGWKMSIPEDWEIVLKNDLDAQLNKGLEMIDGLNKEQSQQVKIIYLLSFKKDKRKSFTALAEAFDTATIDFEQQNKNTKTLLYKTLEDQKIKMDTIWGRDTINSKEFRTFEMVFYNQSKEPLFHQVYYNRQFGKFMFTTIILYDTEEAKNTILTRWRASTFE